MTQRYLDPVTKRFPYFGGGTIDAKTLVTHANIIPYVDGYNAKQRTVLEAFAKRLTKAIGSLTGPEQCVAKGAWSYSDLAAAGLLRDVCGITVILDRPKGTVQRGVGDDGTPWERTYTCDYGFIPDTISPDGEEFDVYVGPFHDAPNAYVICQLRKDGTYDEPKLMLGFYDVDHAIDTFLAHMPTWGLGGVSALPTSVIANLLNIDAPTAMAAVRKAASVGKKAMYKQRAMNTAKAVAEFRKVPLIVTAERATERLVLVTPEGDMPVEPGEWIITDVLGKRYPYPADAFRLTFVPVNDDAMTAWRAAYGDAPLPEHRTPESGVTVNITIVNETESRTNVDTRTDVDAEVEASIVQRKPITSTGDAIVADVVPSEPNNALVQDGATTPIDKDVPARYVDIDFTPPDSVRDAARRGLELHKKGMTGDGLEPETVAWAGRIANGEVVSPEKARQGRGFFARNQRFKDAPKDSPAWASWMLWFGDAGDAWFGKLVEQMDARDAAAGIAKSVCRDNRKSACDVSLDQLRDLALPQLRAKLYPDAPITTSTYNLDLWVTDMYDDTCVYSHKGELWRIGYMYVALSATLALVGEPCRVIRTYEIVAPPPTPSCERTPIPMTYEMVGFYTSPDQPSDQPTFNPTDNRCALCGVDWTDDDVRTHGIMGLDGQASGRLLFYRTHRTCADAVGDAVYDLDAEVFALMDETCVAMSRDRMTHKRVDGRVVKANITTAIAAPALAQATQVGAPPALVVQDMLGRPTILLLRDSGISGEVAARAVEAMRKLHEMPPELAATFSRMVKAWEGANSTNKSSAKAVGDAPELATHPAHTLPLTDRYKNPDAVGGWLGWIEPSSGDWIAFVSTSGETLLWTMRAPDGGVIGDPYVFQRPELIALTSAPSTDVLPAQNADAKALPIPVQIIEPAAHACLVVEPHTSFATWDQVVSVLRARGRSGDDVADILKSLRLPLDERKRALATACAFDSVLRWDGNVIPFRKAGQAEHPVVEAPLEMMFAAPEEIGGWIGWIEPADQRWFALVDADGKARVWLMRDVSGAVLGPAYELKRKDLRQPSDDDTDAKSADTERFAPLWDQLAKAPPTFARNDDGTLVIAKGSASAPNAKRLVYAVVLEPNPNGGAGDAQAHTYDEAFCEEACHYFARFQLLKDNHGERGVVLPRDRVYVAQNFVAPCEYMLGSQRIVKGTWVMVVCIPDDDCWAKVERGEWNAFSIEGHSTHTQLN